MEYDQTFRDHLAWELEQIPEEAFTFRFVRDAMMTRDALMACVGD